MCELTEERERGGNTNDIVYYIQDTYYRDILAHYSFSRSKYFQLLLQRRYKDLCLVPQSNLRQIGQGGHEL